MTYFISTLGIVAGAILVYKGFMDLKLARLMENIPTSKIRSAAMGLVEVHGKALPYDKPLKSPLFKKDCVYYELNINAGNYNKYIIRSHQKFYLKDETGKILIDPGSATTNLPLGQEHTTTLGNTPPEIIRLCKERGLDHKALERYQHPIAYTETIIKPLKEVYIIGTATVTSNEQDRTDAEKIIIKRDDTHKVLYISYRSEKNIVEDMHTDNPWMIYVGAALIVTGFLFMIKFLVGQ